MSIKHPIISVTGSSGAGTSTVKHTFEQIFRREKIAAAFIEGDAFHRYDRQAMRDEMVRRAAAGNNHFSHFGLDANLLHELEAVFRRLATLPRSPTVPDMGIVSCDASGAMILRKSPSGWGRAKSAR